MKITVIAVGGLKEGYLKEGISVYAKKFSSFCELEIVEVDDEQAPESLSKAQMEQVKQKEADRILKRVKKGSVIIALDVNGERLNSEGFAAKIKSFISKGTQHLTFIIGGSLGLDEGLLKRAALRLSFSPMTFPHQLTRLILLEQLCRALLSH